MIHKVFALYCRLFSKAPGAENETRTRDPNLGKVVLYQLSYFRKIYLPRPGKLRFLRFGTANINRKIYSAKFSGEFCRKTMSPAFGKAGDTRMGNPYIRAAE